MVDEPVDHGGGDDVVAEDLAPAAEGLVGGDDQAGAFVAAGDELEEQVGGLGFEGDVADLVDDQQRVAAEPDELVLEPCRRGGPRRAGRPIGRRWRTGRGGRPGRRGSRCPVARWVLPVPGGPRKTTFSLPATKSRVPRWAIRSRLRPRAWSKSNSSRRLRAGNRAARMRPSPPWDSRAETSRCRQATRNSSWVQDSARARSASRGTASRRVGAFSARVRKATSLVRSRLAAAVVVLVGGHDANPPSVLEVDAQGGVVVGQRALLDLDLVVVPGATGRSARARVRRSTLAASRCSGSVRVWCQAQHPFVVGHQAVPRRAP